MKGKCQPNPVFGQRINLCIAGKLSGSGKPFRIIKVQLLCLDKAEVNSLINNKVDSILQSNEFKRKVKAITADVLED